MVLPAQSKACIAVADTKLSSHSYMKAFRSRSKKISGPGKGFARKTILFATSPLNNRKEGRKGQKVNGGPFLKAIYFSIQACLPSARDRGCHVL